jgi:ABC-type phosphate transport system auxiliary subunit
MEEYLLALIIQSENPKIALQKGVAILAESMTRERAYQKILYHLLDHLEIHEQFDGKRFGEGLPQELVPSFNTSALFPLPIFTDEKLLLSEVEKIATSLKRFYLQKRMKELAGEIKEHENETDEEKVSDLRKKYSELASQLQAI